MEHPYFCSVGAYIKTWVLTDPQHGDWVPVLLSELPSSYAVGLLVPGCEKFLRSLGTFAFEWNTGDLLHPLHTMTDKSTWQTETVLQDWNKITKMNNLKKTELFFHNWNEGSEANVTPFTDNMKTRNKSSDKYCQMATNVQRNFLLLLICIPSFVIWQLPEQ